MNWFSYFYCNIQIIKMTQFHIVDLKDGPNVWVAVVPEDWCIGDSCFYPPYSDGHKCSLAALNAEDLSENWLKYSFKVIGTFGINIIFHIFKDLYN